MTYACEGALSKSWLLSDHREVAQRYALQHAHRVQEMTSNCDAISQNSLQRLSEHVGELLHCYVLKGYKFCCCRSQRWIPLRAS